jgi:beta-mannosidase
VASGLQQPLGMTKPQPDEMLDRRNPEAAPEHPQEMTLGHGRPPRQILHARRQHIVLLHPGNGLTEAQQPRPRRICGGRIDPGQEDDQLQQIRLPDAVIPRRPMLHLQAQPLHLGQGLPEAGLIQPQLPLELPVQPMDRLQHEQRLVSRQLPQPGDREAHPLRTIHHVADAEIAARLHKSMLLVALEHIDVPAADRIRLAIDQMHGRARQNDDYLDVVVAVRRKPRGQGVDADLAEVVLLLKMMPGNDFLGHGGIMLINVAFVKVFNDCRAKCQCFLMSVSGSHQEIDMQTIDLTGEWTLIRAKTGEQLPASVPGDTHSALLDAGRIPDPYWADNELAVQWVGDEDWIYRRSFDVPKAMLAERSVFLSCDCLDTVTDIRVNGQHVGSTENMFLRHRFEVKPSLRPGRNTIEIHFHSAVRAAAAVAKTLPYPVPGVSSPVQTPHRNLIRKVQCHAGWDWGVCLMVAGIYGDIHVGACSDARIEQVYCDQRHTPGRCEVTVHGEVMSPAGGRVAMRIRLGEAVQETEVELQPGSNRVAGVVVIKDPQLWWPNGAGEQPLYDLVVSVGDDTVCKRLGLRTIELINEEDAIGLSMRFRVNGRDLFMKGADWIPCDALPQRQTPEMIGYLVDQAAAVHMNMLRVWGGGQYEQDAFYRRCDERGILVWQDFMFACSLYPATESFLGQVRQEAEYQVKRLRDHACLALWCGNNENLAALGWFKEPKDNRDRYLVDYDRLNEGVLGHAVRAFDPGRVFWPSSPCGGPGDYSNNFDHDRRGDMHYWGVWHGGKPFSDFLKQSPRFCSEFGYQSFPSLDTIRTYAPESQFNLTAPVMEHHQRNVGGNSKIIEMFSRYFRLPEGFANFVYLSQVMQGIAIKTAVEGWRRLRPNCMGTIYWQLNDNWPVCSWASLNYRGSWKVLHHLAKRFYAPVTVSAIPDPEHQQVEIWLVNDTAKTCRGAVSVRVIDLSGRVMREDRLAATVPADSAKRIRTYPVAKLTTTPEEHFMSLRLEADGTVFHNEHFFTEWKKCELSKAEIRVKVKAVREGMAVKIETDRPAFYVVLSAPGISGEFDDNGFTLLPGEPRTLLFTPRQKITLADFRKAIAIKHLRETYA